MVGRRLFITNWFNQVLLWLTRGAIIQFWTDAFTVPRRASSFLQTRRPAAPQPSCDPARKPIPGTNLAASA